MPFNAGNSWCSLCSPNHMACTVWTTTVPLAAIDIRSKGLRTSIWRSEDRVSWYILIIKTEMHYFSNLCWYRTGMHYFSNLFRYRTEMYYFSILFWYKTEMYYFSNLFWYRTEMHYFSNLFWYRTQMHYFSNLFWYRTLHVSDRFTVHRQESSTVYTAIGTCHDSSVDCLLARSGSWPR